MAIVLYTLRPGDWTFQLDLQDAYLPVPIHPQSPRFFNGQAYQFQALPFSLHVALMVFTKLVHILAAHLHSHGVSLLPYLDAWISQSPRPSGIIEPPHSPANPRVGEVPAQSAPIGIGSHTGSTVPGHSLPARQGSSLHSPRADSKHCTIGTTVQPTRGSHSVSPTGLSLGSIPTGIPHLGLSVCPPGTSAPETATAAFPAGGTPLPTVPCQRWWTGSN
jgi:hypothetical protein